MLKSIIFIAAGVAVAMPAAAQTTVQPQPVQAPTAKSDVDKLICKKQEEIGSRLGAKKVCMTVAQWLVFQNDVKDQTRRIEILGHVSH